MSEEHGEDATHALRRSEETYARTFIQNPVAMTITNGETGRFTAVNEEFLRLVGYWRSDVIGRTSDELALWPDPGVRAEIGDRLGSGGAAGPIRGCVRARDGALVACTGYFRLLGVSSGPLVLSVLIPDDLLAQAAADVG